MQGKRERGHLSPFRKRCDNRMDIGAENQQAEKEKTGIRKIEGLFAVVEGKARRADGYRRRKTVSGERKDGIRKTEGLFAVVEGKARRADGHRRKDVIEDGEEKQICVGQ